MSIDEAGVSEYVVSNNPPSSDAGPSIDLFEKLTNCPLQPMGVAVGAFAAEDDAETEQLPEHKRPVVVPLGWEGRCG
jgi:hypothetical protein